MKNKFFIAVALIVCMILTFTACSDATGYKNGLDSTTGEVENNGGFAVQKGDYLYYINGIAQNTDSNKYGEVKKGALVRIKKSNLVNTANSAEKYTKDFKTDNKVEVVIPSLFVAGDKTSGFYMFGDEVYYATPTSTKDKTGTVENTKLDFVKTTLDGSKSQTLLTVSDNTTAYRFVEVANKVYLVLKTVDSENKTVLQVYNATDNKNGFTTSAVESIAFCDDQTSDTVYFTVVPHNDDVKEDEEYNELYAVKVTESQENVDKMLQDKACILSGKGALDGATDTAIAGSKYSFVKDTKDVLYLKKTYADKTVVETVEYVAYTKADSKFEVVGFGAGVPATAFGEKSVYVAKDKVVYLDATYGLLMYSLNNTGSDESKNRVQLLYDKNLIGYTVQFYNNGYLYLTDSNSMFYRVNVANLLKEYDEKTLVVEAEGKVEQVTYFKVDTSWYMPEVVNVEGKDYFVALYTDEPYNSLIYVNEIKELTEEEVKAVQTVDEQTLRTNLTKTISYLTADVKNTLNTYFEENYPEKK